MTRTTRKLDVRRHYVLISLLMLVLISFTAAIASPVSTGRIEGQIVLYPAFAVERADQPDWRGIPGQVAVKIGRAHV